MIHNEVISSAFNHTIYITVLEQAIALVGRRWEGRKVSHYPPVFFSTTLLNIGTSVGFVIAKRLAERYFEQETLDETTQKTVMGFTATLVVLSTGYAYNEKYINTSTAAYHLLSVMIYYAAWTVFNQPASDPSKPFGKPLPIEANPPLTVDPAQHSLKIGGVQKTMNEWKAFYDEHNKTLSPTGDILPSLKKRTLMVAYNKEAAQFQPPIEPLIEGQSTHLARFDTWADDPKEFRHTRTDVEANIYTKRMINFIPKDQRELEDVAAKIKRYQECNDVGTRAPAS